MVRILTSIIKQFIFWLLFFAMIRFTFLIYNVNFLIKDNIDFVSIVASFWHALKLDISTTCYILIFPFLLLFVQSIYSPKWINYINKVYTIIIVAIYSLISSGELGIYPEWKTKLHFKALTYLRNPAEAYDSSSTLTFFSLIVILIIQFILGYYIYKKLFYTRINKVKTNYLFSLLFLILTPPFLFLGIRGGIQGIPITQSESYYSKHNILNLAAVNSGWNLALSTIEYYKFVDSNPFESFKISEATNIVSNLHNFRKDTTLSILKTKAPNIVVILLESWSADLIQSLGGEPGITPEFRKLEKEGILFTQHYSTGNRSQQAMASLLGGFPALPVTTLTNHPEKYSGVPSIIKKLNNAGYATSFYFGGQLIYGNMKSYIIYNDFDNIYEVYDFDNSVPKGKLGVHDEYLFDKHINDMVQEKEPFFSILFTLSTHSPYDQPMENVLDWGGTEKDFINSGYYTDRCLGEYFKNARNQDWYKNTLFILVADHSHNSYKNWPINSFEYHKIPLLLYGDVIKDKYKGVQIKKIVSNVDIPVTIMAQLDIDFKEFFWSKDMFNPESPEFAYFELNQGLGWKTPFGEFVYNVFLNHYYVKDLPETNEEKVIKDGKAYLQLVFQQFMDF